MAAGTEQYVSGLGGYMEVRYPSSATGSPGSWVRMNIITWDDNRTSRNAENTHSGVAATNYEHVVPDNGGTFSAGLDVSQATSGYNLTSGTKVDVRFYLGPTGKSELLTFTLLENLQLHDDNSTDIVRISGTFKGGTLTPFS